MATRTWSVVRPSNFFDVNAHVSGLGIWVNIIKQNIGFGGITSRCAHITRALNEIDLNCKSGAGWILFLRVVVYHNVSICNVFVAFNWDIVILHEENGVRSLE